MPPIAIGQMEDDDLEKRATERKIHNRHISTALPNNHINLLCSKRHTNQENIQGRDGIRTIKDSGTMMTNTIAAIVQAMASTANTRFG